MTDSQALGNWLVSYHPDKLNHMLEGKRLVDAHATRYHIDDAGAPTPKPAVKGWFQPAAAA